MSRFLLNIYKYLYYSIHIGQLQYFPPSNAYIFHVVFSLQVLRLNFCIHFSYLFLRVICALPILPSLILSPQ